jgi:hypothetical protein
MVTCLDWSSLESEGKNFPFLDADSVADSFDGDADCACGDRRCVFISVGLQGRDSNHERGSRSTIRPRTQPLTQVRHPQTD